MYRVIIAWDPNRNFDSQCDIDLNNSDAYVRTRQLFIVDYMGIPSLVCLIGVLPSIELDS